MCRTQSHNTAGSIISVNIRSNVICNPRRDLPPCSAVPQPARETEGRLITGDVQNCTIITGVIIVCTELHDHNSCNYCLYTASRP